MFICIAYPLVILTLLIKFKIFMILHTITNYKIDDIHLIYSWTSQNPHNYIPWQVSKCLHSVVEKNYYMDSIYDSICVHCGLEENHINILISLFYLNIYHYTYVILFRSQSPEMRLVDSIYIRIFPLWTCKIK